MAHLEISLLPYSHVLLLMSPELTRVTCNQVYAPGGQALS